MNGFSGDDILSSIDSHDGLFRSVHSSLHPSILTMWLHGAFHKLSLDFISSIVLYGTIMSTELPLMALMYPFSSMDTLL